MDSESLKFEDLHPSDRGILLADQIHELCTKGLLISCEYNPKNVRPASYTLRVGDEFIDSEGNRGRLSDSQEFFVFKKNSIVFVSSKEHLNLPYYVIGRFNVRVTWVYNGVLLGTGPQVDPGFSGQLSCPLYNLTDLDIVIKRGEDFATIDFEKTTTLLQDLLLDQKKKCIEGAQHATLFRVQNREQCFYKLGPMTPLQHCKSHKMTSSLFEMREELRNWRKLGIGAVISFFALTLSLLGFGVNVYRQAADNARQSVEMEKEVQAANEKIADLSRQLNEVKSDLTANQRFVVPHGLGESHKRSP